jgi:PAS domain S-box-containing protein
MRSSLRALLLGLTGLAVIGVELGALAIELTERIEISRQRTASQIQRLSAGVAPVLSNALVVNDLATAEQTLRTMNLDQAWREVKLYEADGQRVILDVSPANLPAARAPTLLRRILPLDPSESRTRVESGGMVYGILAVAPSSVSLENEIWDEIYRSATMSAFLITVLLLLLNLILAIALRPVKALGQSAARFGAGDFSVRMPESRLAEIAPTVRAFNSMATNLERVLGELQAKEAANRRLGTILEQTEEAILTVDLEARITSWNLGARRLLGRSAEEMLGEPLASLFAVSVADPQALATRLLDTRLPERIETEFKTAAGAPIEVMASGSPLSAADGRLDGHIIVARDITERRRAEVERAELEEQFRQAQKTEAVGRLAGGVAHDFNNLLTVITGRSEFLRLQLRADDPLLRHVDIITQGAQRAAKLTAQLLAFSRRQVLQPRVLDLNSVIGGMEEMLRRLIGENIALVMRPAPSLGRVMADPGQVEQILMNLAVNARDAMPEGGRLTLETGNVERDESFARQHIDAPSGSYVMLAVTDSGTGMSAETQARLFEPFFTTKEVGKGTGLGLATVYGIVKQSGGDIWVYSELGRGSCFRVYLPRVDALAETAEIPDGAGAAPQGHETILLVEDEPDLRALALEILEMHGYRVLVAAEAGEACRLSDGHAGRIDLLLTDVVMPGKSGRELAALLTARRPELRVIYMSGYTADAIVSDGVLDPEIMFLQKPYSPATLALKVRDVLDTPAADRAV